MYYRAIRVFNKNALKRYLFKNFEMRDKREI